MTVGFKTRIYPDKQQTELLSYYCRVSHDMYNFLVEKFGSTLVQVEPAYTSRTCSCCGCVKETLDLSERIFICECGNIMDRDVNAARNIAARAICCSH